MNSRYIGGIIGIIVVATGAWWIMGNKTTTQTPEEGLGINASMPYSAPVKQEGTSAGETAVIQTVTYTNEGFSPVELSVKAGTMINFVNQSDELMWVASAPHPTHTLYPEFDEKKPIGKGASYSFTFEKVGIHPYHNHLNASNKGKIIVE